MKDHGLIFKEDSIRAFLEGRKTQTRRVLTRMNTNVDGFGRASKEYWNDFDFNDAFIDCGPSPAGNPGPYLKVFDKKCATRSRVYPIYQVGDRVWVRETFGYVDNDQAWDIPKQFILNPPKKEVFFRADCQEGYGSEIVDWKSPIHLPKDYARIWREITEVRIQRIQEITRGDIDAEGIKTSGLMPKEIQERWEILWNQINEKRGFSWDSNPWVIALTMREIE